MKGTALQRGRGRCSKRADGGAKGQGTIGSPDEPIIRASFVARPIYFGFALSWPLQQGQWASGKFPLNPAPGKSSDQPFLQPGMLHLELLEPAGFRDFHAAELRTSGVERRITEPVPHAQFLDRHAGLGFLQKPDDSLFRKALHIARAWSRTASRTDTVHWRR